MVEKPSLGYAVAGMIGFGPLGALLGALATKKSERILLIDRAVVIDYLEDGVHKQIRCTYEDRGLSSSWWRPDLFEKDLRRHPENYA